MTANDMLLIARLRDDDTDPVMLRQAADLITTLIEGRAGQSHAAGLLAALAAYTEYCGICHGRGSIIEEDDVTRADLWRDCPGCTRARAAIAAAKGGRDAG